MKKWSTCSAVLLFALTAMACGGGGGGSTPGNNLLCDNYNNLIGSYRLACPIRGGSVWHTTYRADGCTGNTTDESYPIASGEYIRTDTAITENFELYLSSDYLLLIENAEITEKYDYAHVMNAQWTTFQGGASSTSNETYAFVVDDDGTIHGDCWVTFIGDGNIVEMANGASIDSGQSYYTSSGEARSTMN